MGIYPFDDVAMRLREAIVGIRAADELQKGLNTHRLNRLEPLAVSLTEIAELLEQGRIAAATIKSHQLVVSVDRSATLNLRSLERSELGRVMGKIVTPKKTEAAKRNGLSGGRPRKDGQPLRRRKVYSPPLPEHGNL